MVPMLSAAILGLIVWAGVETGSSSRINPERSMEVQASSVEVEKPATVREAVLEAPKKARSVEVEEPATIAEAVLEAPQKERSADVEESATSFDAVLQDRTNEGQTAAKSATGKQEMAHQEQVERDHKVVAYASYWLGKYVEEKRWRKAGGIRKKRYPTWS